MFESCILSVVFRYPLNQERWHKSAQISAGSIGLWNVRYLTSTGYHPAGFRGIRSYSSGSYTYQ